MRYACRKWIEINCQFVVADLGTENEVVCLPRIWPMIQASSEKLASKKFVEFLV